jgi:hypothetical protein
MDDRNEQEDRAEGIKSTGSFRKSRSLEEAQNRRIQNIHYDRADHEFRC